jgi:hypothetical protein
VDLFVKVPVNTYLDHNKQCLLVDRKEVGQTITYNNTVLARIKLYNVL